MHIFLHLSIVSHLSKIQVYSIDKIIYHNSYQKIRETDIFFLL